METMVALIFAGLCLVYWLVIILYAGISADFSWIWIFFACAAVMTCIPKIGHFVMVLIGIGVVCMAVLLVPILKAMRMRPQEGLEMVIVEGAQVKGMLPSRSLTFRLEQAWSYAQDNPDTVFILSGGQGRGEDISEAVCMKNWLLDRGLEDKRILLEDQSSSTEENLLFSNRISGCSDRAVGLISNDFHIFRSLMIARRLGYKNVHGIPAASDPVLQIHFVVREVFALAHGMVKHI